jgi:hypothetical protein
MQTLRYSAGFVAGVLDHFGLIDVRNRVLRLVRYDGSTMNGFDRAIDLFWEV